MDFMQLAIAKRTRTLLLIFYTYGDIFHYENEHAHDVIIMIIKPAQCGD
jgi:hypothetical protein